MIKFEKKPSVENIRNIRIFYLGNFKEVENGVPAAAVILLLQVKNFVQNCVYRNTREFFKIIR
jgi:hypothetical protein